MSSVKIENSTLSLYIDDIRKEKIEIHKDTNAEVDQGESGRIRTVYNT